MNKIYQQYMYSYPHKKTYQKLDVNIDDVIGTVNLENIDNKTLYIHIPFCDTRCGYCNLFSYINPAKTYIDSYLDAVERHAKQLYNLTGKIEFTTFVIGGGTPLILDVAQLNRLFEIVQKYFSIDSAYKIIESTPKYCTNDKLRLLKEHNFNRISIGIQSFNKDELKLLNRITEITDTDINLKNIFDIGFECVNFDLIYGIPFQTEKSLKYTLERIIEYGVDEIFAYPLYIQENSNLYGKYVVNEQMMYRFNKVIDDILIENGYMPYSMRRYVKEESKTSTCGFETTFAIGCGGRTYIDNYHLCEKYETKEVACKKIIDDYINKNDFYSELYGVVLSNTQQKKRYVVKNLLFVNGLNIKTYKKHFNSELIEDFPILEEFVKEGLAEITSNSIKLTKIGFSYSDCIGVRIVE